MIASGVCPGKARPSHGTPGKPSTGALQIVPQRVRPSRILDGDERNTDFVRPSCARAVCELRNAGLWQTILAMLIGA